MLAHVTTSGRISFIMCVFESGIHGPMCAVSSRVIFVELELERHVSVEWPRLLVTRGLRSTDLVEYLYKFRPTFRGTARRVSSSRTKDRWAVTLSCAADATAHRRFILSSQLLARVVAFQYPDNMVLTIALDGICWVGSTRVRELACNDFSTFFCFASTKFLLWTTFNFRD